jgi:hypothetical protein
VRARLATILRAGHMLHAEAPAKLADLLIGFAVKLGLELTSRWRSLHRSMARLQTRGALGSSQAHCRARSSVAQSAAPARRVTPSRDDGNR